MHIHVSWKSTFDKLLNDKFSKFLDLSFNNMQSYHGSGVTFVTFICSGQYQFDYDRAIIL